MTTDQPNSPQNMPDKNHTLYYGYINNPTTSAHKPSLEEIEAYLKDAYQGFFPLPLSAENLSKSYGFFSGSYYKETLEKILSDEKIALSLIPGLKEAINVQTFDLNTFKSRVCQRRPMNDLKKVKHLISLYNQRSLQSLQGIFKNPDVVVSALKAVSKKQWGQSLVGTPSNKSLLSATAKLSSEEFFQKGMHLAFLEIEPEIYGTIKAEAASHPHKGFYAKKYLRILLELEEAHQQLTAEKEKAEREEAERLAAIEAKKAAQFVRTNEAKPEEKTEPKEVNLQAPKERKSFIEKLVREELGYKRPVGKEQALKILQATAEILQTPEDKGHPSDFLHSKHPEPRKEIVTFATMDLSKR